MRILRVRLAEKKLALKIINESTYDTSGMLKSRLRKIVARQKKYESKDGDLSVLAESYGLQLITPAYAHTRMKGRTPIAFKPAQGGCYYISLKDQYDDGHGLGFHLPSSTFCDANYGIFDLNGGSIASVIQLYWDEGMGARGNLAYVYPVQLKTDPKIVPAD